MPHNLKELIIQAAKTEATPALVEFWEKQYTQALTSRFRFDPENGTGYINLTNHLTPDKKDIDHQQLQQTISIGVRFLDALSTEPEYREIRLSVDNFDEFLQATDTAVQIGIDYIGSLVSDFSYRASENLAHEKGAFLEFSKIPKHLRDVEYEMWVDKEDNYKNGQELSAMFDDNTIVESPWKLVPRRNFAILDFSDENQYWNKWKDIYQKAKNVEPAINTNENIQGPELSDFSFDLDDSEGEDFSTDFSTPIENMPEVNLDQNLSIENQDVVNQDRVLPNNNEAHSLNSNSSDHQSLENVKSNEKNTTAQFEKQVSAFESDSNPEHPAPTHPVMHENFFKSPKSELKSDGFDFDDLVEPVIPVIESEKDELSTELNHEETMMSDHDLGEQNPESSQEVLESASNINLKPGIDYIESGSAALILNEHNQVLLLQKHIENEVEWTLPSVNIALNQIPEEAILKYLQNNLSANSRILDEVGSVMLSHNPNFSHSLNVIYNVFFIGLGSEEFDLNSKISSPQIISFQFFDIDKLPSASILVKVAIDKHFRRQKQLHEYCEHKVNEWEMQIKPQLESEIRSELEEEMHQKIIEMQKAHESITQPIQPNSIETEDNSEDLIDKNDNFEFLSTNSNLENHENIATKIKHPNLAKFKVKLEQWIESQKFGGIGLALGYSSKGLESIALLESDLDQELKSSLDLILQLFNHLLTQGLDLKTLVSGLNLQHGNNEIKITQILSLILETVMSAPDKISNISEDLLI